MGYSHSWYQKATVPPATWSLLLADVAKLMAALPAEVDGRPLILGDNFGKEGSAPSFNSEEIAFNGSGPKDQDLGHETFIVERELSGVLDDDGAYNSCKTNRKPFDLAVMLVLLAMQQHAADAFTIKSDGNLHDWLPAVELFIATLGLDGFQLPPNLDVDEDIERVETMLAGGIYRGRDVSFYKDKPFVLQVLTDLKSAKEKFAELVNGRLAPTLSPPADTGLAPALGGRG